MRAPQHLGQVNRLDRGQLVGRWRPQPAEDADIALELLHGVVQRTTLRLRGEKKGRSEQALLRAAAAAGAERRRRWPGGV